MSDTDYLDEIREQRAFMMNHVPHSAAIGMTFVDVEPSTAILMVPYSGKLVGNPDTGVIHGGVVTTVLDNACGLAAMTHPDLTGMVATLDLRIDYMRPAKPGKTLWTECECYRLTRSVAFCRGVAYDEVAEDPVATATGAFMITAAATKFEHRR